MEKLAKCFGFAIMLDQKLIISFLDDIKSNPSDDTPRLILADMLSEEGDKRGDAMRQLVQQHHEYFVDGTVTQRRYATNSEVDMPIRMMWQSSYPGRVLTCQRGLLTVRMNFNYAYDSLPFLAFREAFAWVDGLVIDSAVIHYPSSSGVRSQLNHINYLAVISCLQFGDWLRHHDLAKLTCLRISKEPDSQETGMVWQFVFSWWHDCLEVIDLSDFYLDAEIAGKLLASRFHFPKLKVVLANCQYLSGFWLEQLRQEFVLRWL